VRQESHGIHQLMDGNECGGEWAGIEYGIIKIPDKYKELENAFLKIKIQPYKIKAANNKKMEIKHLLEIIVRKNIFKNIANPDEWQRNLRDEWEKGIA